MGGCKYVSTEASSAGIPTLYSNGIGNLSTMKAYLPGLLVQNWNSAKEQLEHLHSNYDKLSDRSRELYENEYSYASVKISWKALLEDEIFLAPVDGPNLKRRGTL